MVRALDLLALFTEDRATWTVRELTRASGLAKTTVLRLIDTLQQRGLLWPDGQGRISAGPGLLRWAGLAQATWRVPPEVQRVMRELSDTCGETVNLYVRSGTHRICIEQQEGRRNLRHIVRVGDELPLWGGAASKVLLADADDDLLAAVADSTADTADTADSAGGPERPAVAGLRDAITEARRAGYAVSHGEREVGASGVAAPITRADGTVLAALALGGPTPRFTDDAVAEFGVAVRSAAGRISDLGLGGAV
ncbi:hypothetical protein BJF85_07205 [Saccharomonospora sp. CUA-673]|nr:hypothetical protein BJF85_07205 [Saccharomonospora sp. CUA-673]